MTTNKIKAILFFTFATSFLWLNESCKKDSSESSLTNIDMKGFWECNASQNHDSTKLAAKLIGSWKWTTQSCFWSGKTSKANKNVKINFSGSGAFSVTENSVVVTQGNWKLKIVDSGIMGLDLDHPSEYLYGRIFLCENQVLFNDSYIDGCDNLFVRM